MLPYEFAALAYSSLTFAVHATQASYDLRAIVHLSALLLEYDVPVEHRAKVWAEILRPDGMTDFTSLSEENAGQFEAEYELRLPGVFIMRVRAQGETMQGVRFERERTLTAAAVPGGDQWSPYAPKSSDLCQIIDCLRQANLLSAESLGRLRELGIDITALLKCLEDRCRNKFEELEFRTTRKGG